MSLTSVSLNLVYLLLLNKSEIFFKRINLVKKFDLVEKFAVANFPTKSVDHHCISLQISLNSPMAPLIEEEGKKPQEGKY